MARGTVYMICLSSSIDVWTAFRTGARRTQAHNRSPWRALLRRHLAIARAARLMGTWLPIGNLLRSKTTGELGDEAACVLAEQAVVGTSQKTRTLGAGGGALPSSARADVVLPLLPFDRRPCTNADWRSAESLPYVMDNFDHKLQTCGKQDRARSRSGDDGTGRSALLQPCQLAGPSDFPSPESLTIEG
jgi:hypothetical protein